LKQLNNFKLQSAVSSCYWKTLKSVTFTVPCYLKYKYGAVRSFGARAALSPLYTESWYVIQLLILGKYVTLWSYFVDVWYRNIAKYEHIHFQTHWDNCGNTVKRQIFTNRGVLIVYSFANLYIWF
jgi:hypothetical protein